MERLKSTADYNKVLKKGEKRTHPFFYLYFVGNGLLFNRLGIRVGRKFGDAHVRNRVKRIIREVYRKNEAAIKGFDVVFIPRRQTEFLFHDMDAAVKKIFLGINKWKKD